MKLINFGLISVLMFALVGVNPAAADDSMLWSTSFGYGGSLVNSGTNIQSIPPYAVLRDITMAVPKTNPDVLIVGMRFDGTFDNVPLSTDKGLMTSLRLFWPSQNCVYQNKCDGMIFLTGPTSWTGTYPTSPSTSQVRTYSLAQKTNVENPPLNATSCAAPWWIDKSDSAHSAIDFQLSITCLNLPADIYAYASAGANIGVTPVPYNFTHVSDALNPFWQLAANAYSVHGGASSVGTPYITPSPQPVPNYIVCKKGKVTKKVLGAKAVCPKGYTKQVLPSANSQ